jgi:hypothetical protein
MFRRNLRVRKKGFRQYPGDASSICNKIIKDCWNGSFLQTSAGHFNQFYSRDLGWCTDALLGLGYKEELKKTVLYALDKFKRHGEITVAITPKHKPFNFPDFYSVDSVAYFFRTVKRVSPELLRQHKDFFNNQLQILFEKAIDKDTGLVKRGVYFSSMKDYALRQSSCYDNVMLAMLADELKGLPLDNPLKDYNYRTIIKDNFWTGGYFLNDLSGNRDVTGDSNIYPFWFGLYDDKMLKSSIAAIQKQKLDEPFPLRYMNHPSKSHKMLWIELFVKHWEQHQVWPQMGFVYIDLLRKIDKEKAKFHLNQYTDKIEENRNFIELYNTDGTPYSTVWYSCDESLLWASMYLDLKKKLKA